jgi:hypothetical protein
MNDFLGELHKVISFSKILSLVGCYRNLKIEYVARVLSNIQSLDPSNRFESGSKVPVGIDPHRPD